MQHADIVGHGGIFTARGIIEDTCLLDLISQASTTTNVKTNARSFMIIRV